MNVQKNSSSLAVLICWFVNSVLRIWNGDGQNRWESQSPACLSSRTFLGLELISVAAAILFDA